MSEMFFETYRQFVNARFVARITTERDASYAWGKYVLWDADGRRLGELAASQDRSIMDQATVFLPASGHQWVTLVGCYGDSEEIYVEMRPIVGWRVEWAGATPIVPDFCGLDQYEEAVIEAPDGTFASVKWEYHTYKNMQHLKEVVLDRVRDKAEERAKEERAKEERAKEERAKEVENG